jgi:ribonuclease P protein component
MTFKRNERLKSEKIITQLFRKGGNSFACYPLRLVYAEITAISDLGLGISEELPPTSDIPNPTSHDPLSILPISKPLNLENAVKSELSPVEFALSVPKKAFKRAVDRNVLRRRIREAYRLNKIDLYKFLKNNALHSDKRFAFMVLYTAKEEMPYSEIEKGIKKMIRKFKEVNEV